MSKRHLALAALLSALLAGGTGAQQLQGDPERGQLLAMGGNQQAGACFNCHGLQGGGDAAQAIPRLTGLSEYYFSKQMKNFASGLRQHESMSEIAKALTQQEWQDLAAFYAALPLEYGGNEADISEDIRRLALQGAPSRSLPACAACHGKDGEGAGNSVPPLAGQVESYLALQMLRFAEGSRANDPANSMSWISKSLSRAEIEGLAAYYAALPARSAAGQN